jgi:hypothetical protein
MKILAPAIIATIAGLSACTPAERGATVGGVTGAAVGGAVTGDVAGAAVGGAVGATAGALIGNANAPGQCYYRDRYGRRYIDDCPG